MARTRIEDLPKDLKISGKEMGRIYGGRCDHQDFSIVKELDKASPLLNLNYCNGTYIDKFFDEDPRPTIS